MLIWIISLLICKYRHLFDAAILFKRICFSRKWEDGFIIRRQSWETQLSQIMNEEVKLCGNTSQTGFNQPRVEKVASNSRTHKILLITLLQAHLKWDRIVHSVTHSNKSLTLQCTHWFALIGSAIPPSPVGKSTFGKASLCCVHFKDINTYTTIKQSGMHSKCNSQTAEQNYSISSNPFAQDYSYRQNILAQVVILRETDLIFAERSAKIRYLIFHWLCDGYSLVA